MSAGLMTGSRVCYYKPSRSKPIVLPRLLCVRAMLGGLWHLPYGIWLVFLARLQMPRASTRKTDWIVYLKTGSMPSGTGAK